jgi:hypothetical protein
MRLFACAKGESCKPCGIDIQARSAASKSAKRYGEESISVILLRDLAIWFRRVAAMQPWHAA